MNILITGGAGYIGSHVAKQFLEFLDYNLVIIDNLSTGKRDTINTLKKIRDFTFIEIDLRENKKIQEMLQEHKVDAIMHFAASIVVPESVENPLKYYINNTVNTANLVDSAIKCNINKFIFSSTAAVYGESEAVSKMGVDEEFKTNPINPYGASKLMSEQIIKDVAIAYPNFKYIIFRYFNVAGADMYYENNKLSPRIGQSYPNATHLIKIASECANGKRKEMSIFGDNFDTSDGTGIRDYVHVDDLANAHILGVEYLGDNLSDTFNIGYGEGFSVKEVVGCMKSATGNDFKVKVSGKRLGDPAMLICNSSKIKAKMNWTPRYNDLSLICKSAYEWEKS